MAVPGAGSADRSNQVGAGRVHELAGEGQGLRFSAGERGGSSVNLLAYVVDNNQVSRRAYRLAREPDTGRKSPKKLLTRVPTRYTFMSAIH